MSRSRINRGQARRAQLRADAEERVLERQKRSPGEQIARLDALLGDGVGARSERARLAVALEKEESEAVKQAKVASKSKPKSRGERRKAKAKRNRDRQQDASRSIRRESGG